MDILPTAWLLFHRSQGEGSEWVWWHLQQTIFSVSYTKKVFCSEMFSKQIMKRRRVLQEDYHFQKRPLSQCKNVYQSANLQNCCNDNFIYLVFVNQRLFAMLGRTVHRKHLVALLEVFE